MLNRIDETKKVAISRSRARSRISRGQGAVEFALILLLTLVVMLVGVQFAMIGQTALALSQGASAIARYAAVNEPLGTLSASYSGAPDAGMQNLLSPSIGTNSWADLTVTINSYKGGTASTTTAAPVATVDRAVVTLSYDASGKIALPNPFLGMVTFPTALSATDSQLYE
jgi:Flp pilus assembly protein TadG